MKRGEPMARICKAWSLALFAVAVAVAAQAGDYTYTTNNGTIFITKFIGSSRDVVIPATIDGRVVAGIGEEAFSHCDFTNVVIPAGVTRIDNWAFNRCDELVSINVAAANTLFASLDGVLCDKGLSTIVRCPGGKPGDYSVPGTITRIADAAFDHCVQLDTVSISSNVTTLGEGVFASCWNLDSITVDAANGAFCSVDGVLFNKAQTTLIQCPGSRRGNYDIPGTVTTIGVGAFDHCPLSGITIPDGVTVIGDRAFRACLSVTSITIPGSVISIGNSAFSYCFGLTRIAIPANVAVIGDDAFSSCEGLMSISVAEANANYSSANGMLFNKNRTRLIKCPAGMNGSVTIPGGVATIGRKAFSGGFILTSVTLPAGVTSIEQEAFAGCGDLKGVYFRGNAPSLGGAVFEESEPVTVYYLAGTTGWGSTYGTRPTVRWNGVESLGAILAQQAGAGPAGVYRVDVEGRASAFDPMFAGLPGGWIARALDSDGLLLQQGDGGQSYIVPLDQAGDPVLAQARKLAGAVPGLMVVSVDNRQVLAQLGVGGPGFLVEFDDAWQMDAPMRINRSTAGMILRSLHGNLILVQAASTGAGYIWRMGRDGEVSSVVNIYNGSVPGVILRSVSGRNVLLQLRDNGPVFIATFDQDWQMSGVRQVPVATSGWMFRSLD